MLFLSIEAALLYMKAYKLWATHEIIIDEIQCSIWPKDE